MNNKPNITSNIKVTDGISDHINTEVNRILSPYDEYIINGVKFYLTSENKEFTSKCIISVKGSQYEGTENSDDMYYSITESINKIERQLSVYKSRLLSKRKESL